jgi:hypothetical protein
MTPNPLATSHEGPHLFRHSRPEHFVVFYNPGEVLVLYEDIYYPPGWYWEGAGEWHGPFSASAYAYMDAKEHKPPLPHNPRHLPVIMDHELRALAEGLLLLYCHFHLPAKACQVDRRCIWDDGHLCYCGPNYTCFEE